uniref:Ammonium_transp domain-containing protein n=1 Tax=Panagrellus redivivus TaxID=6233 RepID=A0A7E4WCD1_PANRE
MAAIRGDATADADDGDTASTLLGLYMCATTAPVWKSKSKSTRTITEALPATTSPAAAGPTSRRRLTRVLRCSHMANTFHRRQFSCLALLCQVLVVILYGFFCRYDENAMPFGSSSRIYVNTDYPLFQDIHVMIFVGCGFLMSFLKRYGFSAISVNLLLASFCVQWVTLLRGFLSPNFINKGYFTISISELMTSDVTSLAVLITMGALLGQLTPVQFLVLAFIESSVAVLLEHLLFEILHINDGGRSLVVHCFGAYFGLACSKVIHRMNLVDVDASDGSIRHSELFSMIGTLFLWVFFPSLNAATSEPEDARHRAIMNTYLSMTSCTVVTFLVSSLSDAFGRFNMLHIQSSTLAGGIAIGTVANVILYPHHAILVGGMTGLLSVVGHVAITPKFFERKLRLYDTCGVHNLHGLPGLLAGILSVFFALWYDPAEYGPRISKIYPHWIGGERGGDRNQYTQAVYQGCGILITLATAAVSGMLTGLIVRMRIWSHIPTQNSSWEDINYYRDAKFTVFSKTYTPTHPDNQPGFTRQSTLLLHEQTAALYENGQSIF